MLGPQNKLGKSQTCWPCLPFIKGQQKESHQSMVVVAVKLQVGWMGGRLTLIEPQPYTGSVSILKQHNIINTSYLSSWINLHE